MIGSEANNDMDLEASNSIISELKAFFENSSREMKDAKPKEEPNEDCDSDNRITLYENGIEIQYDVISVFEYKEEIFAVLLPTKKINDFDSSDFIVMKLQESPNDYCPEDFSADDDGKTLDELFDELKKDFEEGFPFPNFE